MNGLSPILSAAHWLDSQAEHVRFLAEKWARVDSATAHGLAQFYQVLADNFLWLGVTPESPAPHFLSFCAYPEAALQVRVLLPLASSPGTAALEKANAAIVLKALEAYAQSDEKKPLGWQVIFWPTHLATQAECIEMLDRNIHGQTLLLFCAQHAHNITLVPPIYASGQHLQVTENLLSNLNMLGVVVQRGIAAEHPFPSLPSMAVMGVGLPQSAFHSDSGIIQAESLVEECTRLLRVLRAYAASSTSD